MLNIRKNIYFQIAETIGRNTPERGGVLGAVPGKPISRYYYDATSEPMSEAYVPDHEKINLILENEWFRDGIYLIGMIHSHEIGCPFPSCGDLMYAEQILRSLEYTRYFYVPIVTVEPFRMHTYRIWIDRNGKLNTKKEGVRIVC